jgi:Ni2+-binding GTPase involved in maturation of urease and hydrogenase
MKTTLVTVGGFLGAGKTTLIVRAAAALAARGKRVVVVTNDQAPDLVDTQIVALTGVPTAEVAGACFCCAFPDFAAKADALIEAHRPDVVLAEPVGSCVDIAATVLRPLAEQRPDVYRIAPFTVVVDPAAWRAAADGLAMDPATAYIYRKQIAEADLVALNKCDVEGSSELAECEAEILACCPEADVCRLSATDGVGLEAWIDAVLAEPSGGQRRIAVDYDVYAAGEAALGWLNAEVELVGDAEWATVLDALMRGITTRLSGVAHLKCLLRSGEAIEVSNSVAGRNEPSPRTLRDGAPSGRARVTVNARVGCTPEELRAVTEASLAALSGVRGHIVKLRAFAPGRPVPIHRVA